ncbi:AAA family ATPase [Aggregatibacter actinomycetemcomitans]|uniref:AAA family ATPase n=1 Tax=Aggregatibacter actinomycetemcomitans TaxID=714 RepID=UPI00197BCEF5|nr:AAA family ATPase [Aggregatibacter actinomycetemcomitans]MBN6076646.1 AAA family ATPase [Aggregatibacter actinomycetemcomitans]
MNEYISSWLENFERQSMMRRALIVSGNIIDLTFDRFNRLQPVNRVMESSLKAQGFTHIVFYSRLNGISGISSQEWDELAQTGIQSEQGEAYDFGDDDNGDDAVQTTSGQIPIEPQAFFAVVERVMTQTNRKIAFVVDWSNYLFGQVNALSETERAWLQQISSSLRDAKQPSSAAETGEAQSLLVFLCSGNAALPPSVYLNNPLFAEITIALPNIQEREAAILARQTQLNVSDDLSKGSQALADLVTLTDTLTLRDIDNLVRLSRQQTTPLNIQSLVSLYRYGKRQSPWEKLNYRRLKETQTVLQERVKGQDQAIEAVNQILIRAYTGLSGLQHSVKARTPKGALFFVGPTGVGKTELAKSLAQFLFGDEDACIRFDMSEFNHEHADQRLVGAPPGYIGFEEGGQLTNAVKTRPFSLLLFDEIEKAHPRILDKFLQILEDGRLTDGKGETISFADTFIVFTSNIGAADIQPDTPESVAEQFKRAVQSHFKEILKRPELLGRIGEANIIPFNFMQDTDVLKAIARAKLKPLEGRLKEKWGIEKLMFENEDKALDTLVKQVNQQHGGRGVLNVLTKYLFDPLAEFLFDQVEQPNKLKGKTLKVLQAGRHFDFELE